MPERRDLSKSFTARPPTEGRPIRRPVQATVLDSESSAGDGDLKVAAVTINRARSLTPEKVEEIARWLEAEAIKFRGNWKTYRSVYIARFFADEKAVKPLRYQRAV